MNRFIYLFGLVTIVVMSGCNNNTHSAASKVVFDMSGDIERTEYMLLEEREMDTQVKSAKNSISYYGSIDNRVSYFSIPNKIDIEKQKPHVGGTQMLNPHNAHGGKIVVTIAKNGNYKAIIPRYLEDSGDIIKDALSMSIQDANSEKHVFCKVIDHKNRISTVKSDKDDVFEISCILIDNEPIETGVVSSLDRHTYNTEYQSDTIALR